MATSRKTLIGANLKSARAVVANLAVVGLGSGAEQGDELAVLFPGQGACSSIRPTARPSSARQVWTAALPRARPAVVIAPTQARANRAAPIEESEPNPARNLPDEVYDRDSG